MPVLLSVSYSLADVCVVFKIHVKFSLFTKDRTCIYIIICEISYLASCVMEQIRFPSLIQMHMFPYLHSWLTVYKVLVFLLTAFELEYIEGDTSYVKIAVFIVVARGEEISNGTKFENQLLPVSCPPLRNYRTSIN